LVCREGEPEQNDHGFHGRREGNENGSENGNESGNENQNAWLSSLGRQRLVRFFAFPAPPGVSVVGRPRRPCRRAAATAGTTRSHLYGVWSVGAWGVCDYRRGEFVRVEASGDGAGRVRGAGVGGWVVVRGGGVWGGAGGRGWVR